MQSWKGQSDPRRGCTSAHLNFKFKTDRDTSLYENKVTKSFTQQLKNHLDDEVEYLKYFNMFKFPILEKKEMCSIKDV